MSALRGRAWVPGRRPRPEDLSACGVHLGRASGMTLGACRMCAQSMCLAASGFEAPEPAQQYVGQLLGQAAGEVAALAARPDVAQLAARADVVAQVGAC